MLRYYICSAIVCAITSIVSYAGDQRRSVVVYDGIATEVTGSSETSKDLWVTMTDLKRATKFVVKPQGVCRDELCFPIPKNRKAEFVSKKGATSWFNLSEFSRLISQPAARDDKNDVWYFGPRSQAHDGYLETLEAPEFSLPDMTGRKHSLSEYRGKKVLLITWASW
jgi:hypothetical protein